MDANLEQHGRQSLLPIHRTPEDAPRQFAVGNAQEMWAAGLEPLSELLNDPDIEEIWLNQPDRVFAARGGVTFLTGVVMTCDVLARVVSALLIPTGRRLDALSPWVDATLPDGSRAHIVAPVVARDHYALNIRKFPRQPFSLADLVQRNMLTQEQALQLGDAVASGASILVSGPTHSGKTTLVRALAHCLPAERRVVTCEEVFELALKNRDVAALQTRPPGLEGNGAVTLRDLVVQALRMRPDVLIVGEVRQAEAFDLLIALNCGVPALCTIHANDAVSAVTKLMTLASLAGPNISTTFAKTSVTTGLDLVVHVMRDGARRVVSQILPVVGISGGISGGISDDVSDDSAPMSDFVNASRPSPQRVA